LQVVANDLREKFHHDSAASVMSKCTKSCFMSLKTHDLLPTEERCLRNCFVKSLDFQEFFENETRYYLRNQ
jgi:Tim10/DDP family zinc finger